jgi:glycerate kinase
MKIVVAPDKFKGSCPADRAAAAISRGWRSVFPKDEAILIPVADGGEGTLDALQAARGGRFHEIRVQGPLGAGVKSRWLLLPDGTAAIEMALASGLRLVEPGERDVRRADTFGTGQLVLDGLNHGCRRFVVGVGGSATNDGGMGLLRALGARFFGSGVEITAPGNLIELECADFTGFDERVRKCEIVLASDVKNPLCGPEGASAVYGPQKGASPADVEHMDKCLARLSAVVSRDMGIKRGEASEGSGAAGGLGWALMQCCGAAMRPGIEVVLDAVRFDGALAGAGLVITGEGRMDGQTAMGKAPAGVAARAKRLGIPVVALAGSLGEGYEAVYSAGIDCVMSIAPGPMELYDMMAGAEALLEGAAARLAKAMDVGGKLRWGA